MEKANQSRKIKKNSQSLEAWRRFRKRPTAVIALFFFVFVLFLALFADIFWDYQSQAINQNAQIRLQKPSGKYWFGTDAYGRELFVRVVYGARNTLLLGFGSTFSAAVIGLALGSTAAYFGGKYDYFVMRACDIMMSVPGILLVLAVVAGLGTGIPQLIVTMAIGGFPSFTRILRSGALGIVNQEYIEASHALGGSNFYIITRHLFANIISILLVQLTMNMASNMMIGASLSFLGMGAKIPTPEWGKMLNEGMTHMRNNMYLVVLPGIALTLTTLSITLIGDGLRDAFDPKLKGRF
jgi:peptide/nickel transport system permease protein